MLRVDEFESVFRSADKEMFRFAPPDVKRVLLVSDLAGEEQGRYVGAVQKLLGVLSPEEWLELTGEQYHSVEELIEIEQEMDPDLIVAYRNLKDTSWRFPYSLGAWLNVLTQKSRTPVLVVPNPHEYPELSWQDSRTDSVMVVADHLTGDDALVNWGVVMTEKGGALYLSHIEDDHTFERYMQTIGKIPSIDTESARVEILEQLLKEPSDFIDTCASVLAEASVDIRVEKVVQTGHRVSHYKKLCLEHEVDVLVFHSRDEDQVAMHGTAYPLAVELRDVPLLLV